MLKNREVNDPERLPFVDCQPSFLPKQITQRTETVVDDVFLVRTDEHEVAGLGTNSIEYAEHRFVRQELENRRLQTFNARIAIVHLYIGESFGAVPANEFSVVVDLFAAKLTAVLRYD